MQRIAARIWFIEALSVSRLLAALLFAALAFQERARWIACALYIFAAATDAIDGWLARKLRAESYFGKVVDLVGDKSLTIVSLLFAAACGVSMVPLAIIAAREIVVLGLRLITVDGTQLLPTNRLLGGVMAVVVWGNTLFLFLMRGTDWIWITDLVYWLCAVLYLVNLVVRLVSSSERIKSSLSSR